METNKLELLESQINEALLMDDKEENYYYYKDACNIFLYIFAGILLILFILFMIFVFAKIDF